MDVEETLLPGVGVRYAFSTRAGARVGLVVRRAGQVEVVVYPADDPDAATEVLALTHEEADTLAELLGAPRVVERFADLTREIPGLVAAQLEVPAASRYAGRPLGDTRARTRTGVSVVAVVRADGVVASPTPAEVLRPRDVLVVMGTQDGIAATRALLAQPRD